MSQLNYMNGIEENKLHSHALTSLLIRAQISSHASIFIQFHSTINDKSCKCDFYVIHYVSGKHISTYKLQGSYYQTICLPNMRFIGKYTHTKVNH